MFWQMDELVPISPFSCGWNALKRMLEWMNSLIHQTNYFPSLFFMSQASSRSSNLSFFSWLPLAHFSLLSTTFICCSYLRSFGPLCVSSGKRPFCLCWKCCGLSVGHNKHKRMLDGSASEDGIRILRVIIKRIENCSGNIKSGGIQTETVWSLGLK